MKTPAAVAAISVTVLLLSTHGKSPGAPASTPPEDEVDRIVHLLHRATYGPRPGDVERVLRMGIPAWLDEQLHPEGLDDPAALEAVTRFPTTAMSVSELYRAFPPPVVLQPFRSALESDTLAPGRRRAIRRELAGRNVNRVAGELVGARLLRAARSERQLEEVMTAFWFDHFNVFFGKEADRWLVGDYERKAIRPHVFGSFEELLVATATHPAMLYYLDNWRSLAPDSSQLVRAARARRRSVPGVGVGSGGIGNRGIRPAVSGPGGRAAAPSRPRRTARLRMTEAPESGQERRPGGLNENYARELLELHTLGVDGGYTQDDVVAVARIFTGWTLDPPAQLRELRRRMAADSTSAGRATLPLGLAQPGAWTFRFRPLLHDAGEKRVLGETFPAGGGEEEGRRLLHMLSSHPSTARNVATALATRFVADEPPPGLVDELAAVFLATGGDLREVTRTLFTSEFFYAPRHRGARVKSPFLLVAGMLRQTNGEIGEIRPVVEALRALGEVPYLAEAPVGYPEEGGGWADPGALLRRIELATSFASGSAPGTAPDWGWLAARAAEASADPAVGIAMVLLPGRDVEDLVEALRGEGDAEASPGDPAAARILGLVLASPGYQLH